MQDPPVADASNSPAARVKPDPDACFSPDLSNLIKKELLDPSLDVSQPVPFGYRQIQEDGKEVLLILDSDSEEEDFVVLPSLEDGISSDTAVGDSDFGAFQFNSYFELEADKSDVVGIYSELDEIDPMSDIDVDPGVPQTNWLDDGLISRVSNKPCKVTRQRSVDRVEYLNDIPSYWPIPEDSVAYVLDLSDPKFEIKNKDGELLPVDALICDKASKINKLILLLMTSYH